MESKMTNFADRGKYAEGKVKAELKKLEAANCTHHRFPDRRAGSFVTAPADFLILQSGRLRLLEVKQVEHGERLVYGNFNLEQVNRMHMWQLAGADTWVLVYHVPHKAWRLIPADWFRNRPVKTLTDKPIGSWVLTEFPLLTLTEAFTGMKQ
jgi:hypothetical protein